MSTRPGGGPLGRVLGGLPGHYAPTPMRGARKRIIEFPDQLGGWMLTLPHKPGQPYPGAPTGEMANSLSYFKSGPTALRFYAPTFAPYNDPNMPPVAAAGEPPVHRRAIFQTPRFDMLPVLRGSGGLTPNSYGIFQGQTLHVQVALASGTFVRDLTSALRVYGITYTSGVNPEALSATDKWQDFTGDFWNANDATVLNFPWPAPARYWSTRLVFDLMLDEVAPVLFLTATVV